MPRKQSEEDVLATARERFRLARTAEEEIRREARIDLEFCAGNQWEQEDRDRRMQGGHRRPCLTFNKLSGPLNMTANDARLNTPGIEVHPVDSDGDPDTAKVIQGMINHIQEVSKADEVYETAIEQSASGSFGYFRVGSRYCGARSFDQELRIERVLDPFTIYIDPFARESTKSDMRWAFELEFIPRDDYEREYGESAVTQMNFYDHGVNPAPDWISREGVQIARYWDVSIENHTLVAIEWPDGKITNMLKEEVPGDLPDGLKFATGPDGKPIERDTEIRRITVRKINGIEILEETEWPGQWVPILPVLGKEMYVAGKRYLFSLVRFARDAQRLYNFYRSAEAETVALGTKAPWVGVKGTFKDSRWATANTTNWAYLEYEPMDIAGQPAPAPMRNTFEPPIQALSAGAMQASDDIKATTNVFDASLGAMENDSSGIAIQRRQTQSSLSNVHFVDNLNRAIRQAGVILTDLIPKIYDTPREVRILGEDRKQQIVKVNQAYVDDKGIGRCYDLANGQYDVTITTGPSYPTQRQQAFDMLTKMAQAYPQIMSIAGDVIFSNADFPGADKLADRLRKTLPPGLQDPEEGQPQIPPAAAAQMQQMAQTIDQLTQVVNEQSDEIRSRRVRSESEERVEQMKIESSDRQAAMKAQVDLIEAEIKAKSTEDIVLLRAQLASLQQQIGGMASGQAAAASQPPPIPVPPLAPVPLAAAAGIPPVAMPPAAGGPPAGP